MVGLSNWFQSLTSWLHWLALPIWLIILAGYVILVVLLFGASNGPSRMQRPSKRLSANEKAEAILRAHLTPTQLKEYDTMGCFWVHTPRSQYLIRRPGSRIQRWARYGFYAGSYCIVTRDLVPAADWMLAMKLLIEADEVGFVSIGIHYND